MEMDFEMSEKCTHFLMTAFSCKLITLSRTDSDDCLMKGVLRITWIIRGA